MYDVRVYRNTGFNSINIIDNPAKLNDSAQFDFFDLPALDILQNFGLGSVRVRASWQQLKNADYCRIGNIEDGYFYYSIPAGGVRMHSKDVAEISLIPDYVTSAGGLENVEILDGIVTRCHVSDDTYGAWNIDDEFLTPSEPLLLDTDEVSFGKDSTAYVESSLDLGAMSMIGSSDAYIDSEGESVQVPAVISNMGTTQYTMDGKVGSTTETTLAPLSTVTRKGINRCRALGIESAVRSTTLLPDNLLTVSTREERISFSDDTATITLRGGVVDQTQTIEGAKNLDGHSALTYSIAGQVTGNFVDTTTNLAYEYQNVNNKRVLYGKLNRVGILTTAGNRLESNPEETRSGNSKITIRSIGDPHPTGAPYHRFKTMNGNSSKDGFFMNAVKGLSWKQIPLMYSEKSGSALDKIDFQNSRTSTERKAPVSVRAYNKASEVTDNTFLQHLAGNTAGMLEGLFKNAYTGMGAVSGALGGIFGSVQEYQDYDFQRRQEMQQFAIDQTVVSPEVSISYDGEAFRDFYGETVIVYRYRPTPTDIRRLDNILTMYGYKVNIAGKDVPLHNRQYFNYVMGNLSIGGNLPRWMCDGISAQVSGGVRLWHVKPSQNYYNNNPIV